MSSSVHHLHQSDDIIVLSDGRIAQHGSYDNLMASDGLLGDLVSEFATDHRAPSSSAAAEEQLEPDRSLEAPSPVRDDEGHRGGTGWAPFAFYLKMVEPYRLVICGLIILIAAPMPLVINIYQNYWSASVVQVSRPVQVLAVQESDPVPQSPRDGLRRFFGGYVGLEIAYIGIFFLNTFYLFCVTAPVAARRLHKQLLTTVLA